MIHTLYPIGKLDLILYRLNDDINDLKEYVFEGDDYNKINFNRLLVFYVDKIFKKAVLDISLIDRWLNAYYWYSYYINELKKQCISIENHRQPRFKLLEQIDYVVDTGFDWNIIERIENEFDLK